MIFTDEEAATLFDLPPPYTASAAAPAPTLAKLVAIPQIATSFDAPFVRAYPPSLHSFGITLDEWLSITDGLNMAMGGSPPLAVVDTVGSTVGFVPYNWDTTAEASEPGPSKTGTRSLAKTLTDRFLIRLNETYFAPRGLHARLCKTPALRALAHPGSAVSKPPSTLSKVGKTAKIIGLHLPITRLIINAFAEPLPPSNPDSPDASGRRVAALQAEGIIADLDYHVPPQKTSKTRTDKMSALMAKLASRNEMMLQRQRHRLQTRQGRPVSRRDMKRQTRSDMRQRTGLPMRKSKLQRRVEIADRHEYDQTDKLTWFVIVDAEQNAAIEGREEADTRADLQVDDEDWREEMEVEHQEADSKTDSKH